MKVTFLNKNNLIKADRYDDNLRLYIEEGLKWIKNINLKVNGI